MESAESEQTVYCILSPIDRTFLVPDIIKPSTFRIDFWTTHFPLLKQYSYRM